MNWCKLCLLGLTKVFGLGNGRLVGTGKTCPNSQESIKIITTINRSNKQQENESSKLKRRNADLRESPNPNARKYYKLKLYDRRDTLDTDPLKVNTDGQCQDVAQGSSLMDRT